MLVSGLPELPPSKSGSTVSKISLICIPDTPDTPNTPAQLIIRLIRLGVTFLAQSNCCLLMVISQSGRTRGSLVLCHNQVAPGEAWYHVNIR